jgi:hypothetical protein
MSGPVESATPSRDALKLQHTDMRRRVNELTATLSPGAERREAVVLSNHLAEAFAWILATDVLHAESVLKDLEPKLARLEANREAQRVTPPTGADPNQLT